MAVRALRRACHRKTPGFTAGYLLAGIPQFLQVGADFGGVRGVGRELQVSLEFLPGAFDFPCLFQKHLSIPSVMMGFGLPDDNLHAPNEKFHIPNFYRGMESVARFMALLGK